jgi:inosose dehydratase
MTSRREFLCQLGVGAAGALGPLHAMSSVLASGRRADAFKFGYAAITWGGDDERAIDDISALGFPGIQLRANVLGKFRNRPAALRDLLARRRLTFVALSSGNVPIDPALESEVIDEHVEHAKFLRDAGGLYLQLIDERPKGRAVESSDYARLGRLLTEIGKRVADLGVRAAYHPHAGSIGERPDEIDRVLDATDPTSVGLLLDVAHYQVGGGDPVAAVRRYAQRIQLLHIKDVVQPAPGAGMPSFQFVELGRGMVDLKGVFAALRAARFDGWAVIELDSVPSAGETPKDAGMISKRYIEQVIGARVS